MQAEEGEGRRGGVLAALGGVKDGSLARARSALRGFEGQKELERKLKASLQECTELREAVGVLTRSHEEVEGRAARAEGRVEREKEKLNKARAAAKEERAALQVDWVGEWVVLWVFGGGVGECVMGRLGGCWGGWVGGGVRGMGGWFGA